MMTRCHLHGFASPTAKGMPTMVGFGKFHPDSKAELLQEGIFFLIHLFAIDVLVMKKLEIE